MFREISRITLTYDALNDLTICACDSQNSYFKASSSDKHYVVCGLEFVLDNVRNFLIIVQVLCGRKHAGAKYWRHDISVIEKMDFSSCKADPDFWLHPTLKSNGVEHYQCIILCIADILAIMEKPERFLRQ